MPKTYRFIKKDMERQKKWQKFMRMFRAYHNGVPKNAMDSFFVDNYVKIYIAT